MPYYSFIFLCYNNWNMSKQAIETLIKSLDGIYIKKGIEIIIVDNASIDETSDGIKEIISRYSKQFIEIIHIKLNENMGYPIGVNIGLSQSRGEIIGILNNDLIFPKGWFNGLSKLLEIDETIGVTVPYLSYAYGIQNIGIHLNTIEDINIFGKKIMEKNKDKITYAIRVVGACMLLKKEVLEKVGGNDFWYGIGNYDDDDWCLRIRMAGFKIAIVGNSFVYHIGSKTFKQIKENTNHYVYINKRKFYKKWGLTEDRNLESLYIDRDNIIKNTNFVKDKYYIPTDFKNDRRIKYYRNYLNKNGKKKLLVADWGNMNSTWKEKLQTVLDSMEFTQELNLWIPSRYFNINEVIYDVKKSIYRNQGLEKTNIYINYIEENIQPINLLNFLDRFDIILKVESDFVNKYSIYLGRKLNKVIK